MKNGKDVDENKISKDAEKGRKAPRIIIKTPAQRVAFAAVMTALALVFGYVESLIPINFGIPGIKLGLSNLSTLVALYILGAPMAALISLVRILLSGLLFGNLASIAYSLAGGLLSFLIMLLLKKIPGFSVIGVSIAGGVGHNMGQILMAWFMLGNINIVWYFPVLAAVGAVCGLIIGLLSKKCLTVITA